MANFFTLISFDEVQNRDDFYLQTQLPNNELSIGWGKINPIGSTSLKIKDDIIKFYPDREGTINPWNGEVSLPLFCMLNPGDIVFVRGNARILDIAVVTGKAFYKYGEGHHNNGNDYCTKISFIPLFADLQSTIEIRNIPEPSYSNIFHGDNTRRVMRQIEELDGRVLMKLILNNVIAD